MPKIIFDIGQKVPIKLWNDYVEVEDSVIEKVKKLSTMSIVENHIAIMPDTHDGKGSVIGCVFGTHKAIIPAAVGVDIGCGMMWAQTTLKASDIPDNLQPLYDALVKAIPAGRTNNGRAYDVGAWHNVPDNIVTIWEEQLADNFKALTDSHPKFIKSNSLKHLGTLGTGNHFIELCLDQNQNVSIMLHSGSRGIGNAIGMYFISKAKEEMLKAGIGLLDQDLAYLEEGSENFNDYVFALRWAQRFAKINRQIMMDNVMTVMRKFFPTFSRTGVVVNCHHNYVREEEWNGKQVWMTRKGAISAELGEWGIIPGSMGKESYIVQGKQNPESFHSSSHGAGRRMSRGEARRTISQNEHIQATAGIMCDKTKSTIDESPAAYKSIEDVMKSQEDLTEIKFTLKQFLNIKGKDDKTWMKS